MTKVLAFTCSCHRPIMLRHCIMQMQLQSHPVDHVVFVNSPYDSTAEYTCREYQRLLEDFYYTGRNRLVVAYGPSGSQHQNYLNALRLADPQDYDLFLKVDDDDIYLRQYVRDVVDDFEARRWDFSGGISDGCLNGYRWQPGTLLHDLGLSPKDRAYGIPGFMPPTAAFSRKAIEVILQSAVVEDLPYEDIVWRRRLAKTTGIRMMTRKDRNFIYNIHGGNMSTAMFFETDQPGQEESGDEGHRPS